MWDAAWDGKGWKVGGVALDRAKTYRLVMNDCVLCGNQRLEKTGEVVFRDALTTLANPPRPVP